MSLWFTDEFIYSYMNCIKEMYGRTDIAYVDSLLIGLIVSKIKQKDEKSLEDLCIQCKNNYDMENKTKILIPFVVSNNHWLLAIVMIKSHHIFCYDSFNYEGCGLELHTILELDKIRDFLIYYGMYNKVSHFDTIPWLSCSMPFRLPQTDISTCGTFALITAHIASMLESECIPTDILITEPMKIHRHLLGSFYENKKSLDVEVIDPIFDNWNIEWKKLMVDTNVDEFARLENNELDIIQRPTMLPNGKTNAEMDHRRRTRENMCVMGEKMTIYEKSGIQLKDMVLYPDSYTIDEFGTENANQLFNLMEEMLEIIREKIDPQVQIVDVMCRQKLAYNTMILERFVAENTSRMDIKLILNVLEEDLPFQDSRVIVPFHDYDVTMVQHGIAKKKRKMHECISNNNTIYCIKNEDTERLKKILRWNTIEDWISSPKEEHKIRLLLLDSIQVRKERMKLEESFLKKKDEKNILCSTSVNQIGEEITLQMIWRDENKFEYEKREQECDEKIRSIEEMGQFFYARSSDEQIVNLSRDVEFAFLCNVEKRQIVDRNIIIS